MAGICLFGWQNLSQAFQPCCVQAVIHPGGNDGFQAALRISLDPFWIIWTNHYSLFFVSGRDEKKTGD